MWIGLVSCESILLRKLCGRKKAPFWTISTQFKTCAFAVVQKWARAPCEDHRRWQSPRRDGSPQGRCWDDLSVFVMLSPVGHLLGKCGAGKQRFESGPVFLES